MIVLEEEEQEGDDTQKPWCNGEFEKDGRGTYQARLCMPKIILKVVPVPTCYGYVHTVLEI